MRKSGTGNLALAGNNTFSGATTVNSGTLQLGNGGAAAALGTGSITNNSVLAFNRNDSGLAISVPINGGGSVVQLGSGTTTLAANNGYGGGTVISNGALQVGNGGNTGSLSSGPIANNGALIFNRSDSQNVANTISGSGAIYQIGGGSVSLNGNAASFTGAINVNAGNVYINSSNAASAINVGPGAGPFTLGGSGTVTAATVIVSDGGNVEGGSGGHGSLTLAGLNFLNTGNVNVNNIDLNNQYATQGAIIVSGSNGLTAQGSASSITINLGGVAPLNASPKIAHLVQYSGSIQGGGLASPILNTGGIVGLSSRATFNLVLSDTTATGGYIDVAYSVDYPVWTGLGNGVWTTSPPAQSPHNWKLASDSSPTDFLVNNVVVFSDSAAGTTTVTVGSGNVSPAGVIFSNNTKSYVITGVNGITGLTGLTMNGTGSVTINNANSYYGITTLNAGRLNVANSAALGSAGLGAAFTINGGSLDSSAGPLTTDDYPLSWNGPFTFVGSNPLNLGAGGATLGTSAAVNVAASTLTIAGPIGDAGMGLGFTKSGAGTLLLLGNGSYTGLTTVSGGTLQVGNGGTGALITTTSGISIAAGAVVAFNDTDNVTMNMSISGNGKVSQQAGLLTLTNSNSYTGGTSVNGGTLQLSNGGPTGTLAAQLDGHGQSRGRLATRRQRRDGLQRQRHGTYAQRRHLHRECGLPRDAVEHHQLDRRHADLRRGQRRRQRQLLAQRAGQRHLGRRRQPDGRERHAGQPGVQHRAERHPWQRHPAGRPRRWLHDLQFPQRKRLDDSGQRHHAVHRHEHL